jgi:hypothetical protein
MCILEYEQFESTVMSPKSEEDPLLGAGERKLGDGNGLGARPQSRGSERTTAVALTPDSDLSGERARHRRNRRNRRGSQLRVAALTGFAGAEL